jgi:hypothetical protein
MSTDNMVSEARALVERLDDAQAGMTRAGFAYPTADRARAARDSVLRKIEAGAPDLLRGLLALVDEQRARLDALAPLAEAAARVREARAAAGLASAAYGVAYDAWRVSPETHAAAVSRCLGESEQARRVLHDAERALLAHLALARGER